MGVVVVISVIRLSLQLIVHKCTVNAVIATNWTSIKPGEVHPVDLPILKLCSHHIKSDESRFTISKELPQRWTRI